MTRLSTGLIDESPLLVLPTLARAIGDRPAMFLQQLHYWLKTSKHIDDQGNAWVYNTYAEWHKQFDFWDESTLRRIIKSLEVSGVVRTCKPEASNWKHTKWYSIDYEALNRIIADLGKMSRSRSGQNEQIDLGKMSRSRSGQNEQIIEEQRLHRDYHDSPTERDACAPAAPDTPPTFVADDPQPDTLPAPESQPQTEPLTPTLSGEADEKESMPAAARDKNHNAQPGHPRSSAHPAVRACREITGRSPNQVQRQAIVVAIGDTEENLHRWRSTLQRYMTQGRNPTNVEWMLDCYRQPEKLEPPKPKSNTKSSRKEPRNGRRNRSRHPDAAVEEGDESKSYPSYLQV